MNRVHSFVGVTVIQVLKVSTYIKQTKKCQIDTVMSTAYKIIDYFLKHWLLPHEKQEYILSIHPRYITNIYSISYRKLEDKTICVIFEQECGIYI